jgi:hypothetical protein
MYELGLIENVFDVDEFIVKEPLEKVLNETGLKNSWVWH